MRNTGGMHIMKKHPRTYKEQVDILKSRGLIINDENKVYNFLKQNNYYRFAGYFRFFQVDANNKKDDFKETSTFDEILQIYTLDKQLRLLLVEGLENFEIMYKSRLAYSLSHFYKNQFMYLDKTIYKNKNSNTLIDKINSELVRSNDLCIKHFKENNEKIPFWAGIEVFTFGTVSKIYSSLIDKTLKKDIIKVFNVFNSYKNFISILISFVNLRNICMHYGRVWNKKITSPIPNNALYKKYGNASTRSHWKIITMLIHTIDSINGNNNYSKKVLKLCKSNKLFFQGLTYPNL
jgi:abortive infection bacteriophage resistance protein